MLTEKIAFRFTILLFWLIFIYCKIKWFFILTYNFRRKDEVLEEYILNHK
jgi:hypothetical protein